jgi:hypothetical protein
MIFGDSFPLQKTENENTIQVSYPTLNIKIYKKCSVNGSERAKYE